MKKALITGIAGQDGSYLAEFLLDKGYEVWGTIRRSSSFNTGRIDHIFDRLKLIYADMTDSGSINQLIYKNEFDEIYNLAAQSHVKTSFDIPEYTADTDALGTLRILEAIKQFSPESRFYQASSSEMFGSSPAPQDESTPFCPRSPYGVSKLFSYWMTDNYREGYDLHASNGILFNHESPRRGETFVTRKITRAVVNILQHRQDKLFLGNLNATRDWGYAPEYVEAMHLMLQKPFPNDYVIATGESHTVREFVSEAFSYVNLDWEKYVEINQKYFRPNEVNNLKGDARKARYDLGWIPKTKFKDLVKIMMKAELYGENIARKTNPPYWC